jgi:DNA-3-methyladenine glycosylase
MKLTESFYVKRNVTTIARLLLGKILVTKVDHKITSGMIVETEAYSDIERGSHAFKGMTKRNEVMFDRGGKAYVYLCYGMHEMFNVVTNGKGKADAILIRALQPLEGIETMLERMNTNTAARITSGPGKLAKAMGIDRKLNGEKLESGKIWIEDTGIKIKPSNIVSSPRIGIDYAGEDALLPWRFTIRENKWISKK